MDRQIKASTMEVGVRTIDSCETEEDGATPGAVLYPGETLDVPRLVQEGPNTHWERVALTVADGTVAICAGSHRDPTESHGGTVWWVLPVRGSDRETGLPVVGLAAAAAEAHAARPGSEGDPEVVPEGVAALAALAKHGGDHAHRAWRAAAADDIAAAAAARRGVWRLRAKQEEALALAS